GGSAADAQNDNTVHIQHAGQTVIEFAIHRNAQRRTDILAAADQLRHDAVDGIHRYGEADTCAGAARAVDGGVDADQAASRIKQGAAGIAGVDGCIGLNQIVDNTAAFTG